MSEFWLSATCRTVKLRGRYLTSRTYFVDGIEFGLDLDEEERVGALPEPEQVAHDSGVNVHDFTQLALAALKMQKVPHQSFQISKMSPRVKKVLAD